MSGGDEPPALSPAVVEGFFDGFGVSASDRGRFVVRGVDPGAGGGVILGVGAGVARGVGVGVGPGVGVARGWDGLGLFVGFANGVTPFEPPPSGWSDATAGAPRIAVTRMATASDADLARARLGMV